MFSMTLTSGKLSLNEFRRHALLHGIAIERTCNSLSEIYDSFKPERWVWPSNCDNALTRLVPLQEPIQDLDALLQAVDLLPLAVIPLRFPLMVALKRTDKQLTRVLQLIDALRDTCQRASGQTTQQQTEVRQALADLWQSNDDILKEVSTLRDRAQFQEKIYRQKGIVVDLASSS